MSKAISIKILGDTSQFDKATKQVNKSVGGIGSSATKVGGIIAGAFAGKEIVSFFSDSVKGAMDDEKAQVILKKTLENTVGATKAQVAGVENQISAWQNQTGVMDDELRPAYANLIRASHDTKTAHADMNTVMDIAAAKGLDVVSVSQAVAKAHKGQYGPLQKLGVVTKDATGKTLSFDEVMKNANKTFGGSAQKAADTTTGKMAILKAKFEDFKETVGAKLIPIIQKMVGFFTDKVLPVIKRVGHWVGERLPGWFAKAKEVFQDVIGGAKKLWDDLSDALGSSKGPILAVLGGIAAALVLVAIAWNAGPGLIITGVVLLVGALLYAYQHCEAFRTGVQTAFAIIGAVISATMTVIQTVIQTAWAIIQGIWNTYGGAIMAFVDTAFNSIKGIIDGVMNVIKGIINVVMGLIHGDWSRVWTGIKQVFTGIWQAMKGYVSLVLGEIKLILSLAWETIKKAIQLAWDGIKFVFSKTWDAIKAVFSGVGSFFGSLWDGLGNGLEAILNGIIGAFEWTLNKVIDLINGAIGAYNSIPLIDDIGKIDHVSVGRVHIGGSDSAPKAHGKIGKHAKGGIATKSTIGEFGEAGPEAIIPLSKNSLAKYGLGSGTNGGDVHIHVAGSIITERQLLQYIKDGLITLNRKGYATSYA